MSTTLINIHTNINYMNKQIDKNINEYNEIDLTHICEISECRKIYTKKEIFEWNNKYNYLDTINYHKPKFIHLFDDIYIYNFEIYFYNKTSNTFIETDLQSYIFKIIYNSLFLMLMFSILFFIFLYYSYKRERNESMITNIGNEAILANKSMVMITENVHHELNTPVDVINNKVEKIQNTLHRYIESQKEWAKINGIDKRDTIENRKWNKKILNLDKDFEFIKMSMEQIHFVLEKMKNFKTLKYSNGDKTVYDIIEGAFKIISVSYENVKYSIDPGFENYRMAKNSLKNIDLLNILINHIKNSLEANSTYIKIDRMHEVKNNLMTLVVNDNGAGIPKNIIKNVFLPNFSSKQIGDSIRGNGMYLNKHIITEFGGDIKILQSSTKGTSIAITFLTQPVLIKNDENIH